MDHNQPEAFPVRPELLRAAQGLLRPLLSFAQSWRQYVRIIFLRSNQVLHYTYKTMAVESNFIRKYIFQPYLFKMIRGDGG